MVIALLFLASWIVTAAPWIASCAGAVIAAGAVWHVRGFVKGNELQGQLDQKDEIIKTNEQTIESFRARVMALEADFGRVVSNAKEAEASVSRLDQQLKALEKYAAPEAVERFEAELNRLAAIMREGNTSRDEITRKLQEQLDRIEQALANIPSA
jgi:chromosome segregation ATPase